MERKIYFCTTDSNEGLQRKRSQMTLNSPTIHKQTQDNRKGEFRGKSEVTWSYFYTSPSTYAPFPSYRPIHPQTKNVSDSMFLPDHSIAALLHFLGECCTTIIISLRGPKGVKEEKNLLQNILSTIRTHAYVFLKYKQKFNWLWRLYSNSER